MGWEQYPDGVHASTEKKATIEGTGEQQSSDVLCDLPAAARQVGESSR